MPKNNKEFQTPTFFKVVLPLPEMQEIQTPLEMLHFLSLGVFITSPIYRARSFERLGQWGPVNGTIAGKRQDQ